MLYELLYPLREEIFFFNVFRYITFRAAYAAGTAFLLAVRDVDKKIHIEETAQGKIKMTVTETVDGKPKTSKYEAKNADELKKKHPDAHKLYKKYGQNRVRGRAIQALPLRRALPVPFKIPANIPRAGRLR